MTLLGAKRVSVLAEMDNRKEFELKQRISRKKEQMEAIINEHERCKIEREIKKLNKELTKMEKKNYE